MSSMSLAAFVHLNIAISRMTQDRKALSIVVIFVVARFRQRCFDSRCFLMLLLLKAGIVEDLERPCQAVGGVATKEAPSWVTVATLRWALYMCGSEGPGGGAPNSRRTFKGFFPGSVNCR